MMQDEEVLRYSRFEHGHRHVDQEGARCIDDGPSVMQDEERCGHTCFEH